MSRRPSVLSVGALLSPKNDQINVITSPKFRDSTKEGSHQLDSVSLPKLSFAHIMDPNELFTKHTVPEIKAVQQRLRADANAKQEELRLMVGERYRDLLQASASIISIARSSKRVMKALEETKDVISAQKNPALHRQPSVHGNDDTQLPTLQVLSAHIKLLLDAPEHLWRLIERKNFFHAAWLFLLARVVHQALVRNNEQDEDALNSQGLDVLEQFPLVRRQWDIVSQFRSQIVHKAILSLREHTMSSENTCATLLTLHLLDSRPLADTLSVLLDQRSKTLHTILSWTLESSEHISSRSVSFNRQMNGHVPEKSMPSKQQTRFRRILVREVQQAIHTALDAISLTLEATRRSFKSDSSQLSMIGVVLEYMQSDLSDPFVHSKHLPAEFQLTTQALLMALPSSSHFLLLPPSLRMYKPYVDLTSSSSSISQAHLTQTLDEWFFKSARSLQTAAERWLSDLNSVNEVWNTRSSIRKWISSTPGLQGKEMAYFESIFEDVCHNRVIGIWKLALAEAEKAFHDQLDAAVSGLRYGSDGRRTESSPVDFLFQAPQLPVLSQTGLGLKHISFDQYKSMLRRQLVGRTSLLEAVLITLENCALTLQQDVSHLLSGDCDDTPMLVEKLTGRYRPDAESLCFDVVKTLESTAGKDTDGSEAAMNSLVFIGKVADELASQSPFLINIGCGENAMKDFRKKTKALHDRIIDRWRKHTVSQIVQQYRLSFRPPSRAFAYTLSQPSAPSPDLVQSLLTLSKAIQQLGISRDHQQQNDLANKTLRLFITTMVGNREELDDLQALPDLQFLRKLADIWGAEWLDIHELLEEQMSQVREKCHSEITAEDHAELVRSVSDHAGTTDKFATLLPHGGVTLDQKFQPAIELAKPSSRFGLLLVGGTIGTNPSR